MTTAVTDPNTTTDPADDDATAGAAADAGQGAGETDALGDAGKQAIDRMKAERNDERTKRRQLEAEIAELKKPKPAEGEKPELDLDALRQQIRDEARAETLKDKVLDKIEAKAARLFKDPEDALLRLGKSVDDFIVDGKPDVEAIEEALADLLKKRPDFGLTQSDAKRFQGTADGGAKTNAGKPQLTDADVKKLAREGKHEEIEAARNAGQLNTLLGIKS